jgi:quercetin dioxygenase-like cupin family protein
MSQDKPYAAAPDEDAGLPQELETAMFENLAPAGSLDPQRNAAIKSRLMRRVRAERQPGLTTIQADEGDWKPFLPKVRIKTLQQSGDTLTYLLRLEPGAILVPHDHPQDEECIVLEGEVRIGQTVARAGAYHLAPKGMAHDSIVSDNGALLFLRGAVPDASQVRWASLGTLAALSPEPLRNFIMSHWQH